MTTPNVTATYRHELLLSRCDRCQAPAVYKITTVSGLHLMFCGHHERAHRAGLDAQHAVTERVL